MGKLGICSLLRGVVSKFNALLNVALQALNGLAQQLLLLLGNTLEGVGGLLGSVGLKIMSANIP